MKPSGAQAASVYDDVIVLGETVAHCATNDHDLSASYQYIIKNTPSSSNKTSFLNYLDDAFNEGQGWALVQHVYAGGYKEVKLLVSTQPASDSPFFANYGGPYLLMMPHAVTATIYCNGGSSGSPVWGVDFNVGNVSREMAQNVENSWIRPVSINMPFTYPDEYEGLTIPTGPLPAPKYVAMGDSFSSGEGNPPFEAGTDVANGNNCHRSFEAYPYLLHFEHDLGPSKFVACSGAVSDQMKDGGSGHGAWGVTQTDSLSSSTEMVTITVGGNNIMFSDFAYACVFGSCATSSSEYLESWDIMTDLLRQDYLPARLDALFSEMAFNLYLNTNVKVYVVGYPYVITHSSWEGRGVGICTDFDEGEAIAAESLVLKLNTVIEQAVEDFNDSRFIFVNPLATGSPFHGHELCTSGGYFNGIESAISPGEAAYVFHPNAEGQQAYADLIGSYMN